MKINKPQTNSQQIDYLKRRNHLFLKASSIRWSGGSKTEVHKTMTTTKH